jgi:hypothetical protein
MQLYPHILIDAIANAARRDLFEPAGVDLPPVPIQIGLVGKVSAEDRVDAQTQYMPAPSDMTRPSKRVLAILEAATVPVHAPFLLAITNDLEDFYGGPKGRLTLASTLVHEMVHTAFDSAVGHGPRFVRLMHKVGLTGTPEKSVASPRFERWFDKTVMPEYEAQVARMEEMING